MRRKSILISLCLILSFCLISFAPAQETATFEGDGPGENSAVEDNSAEKAEAPAEADDDSAEKDDEKTEEEIAAEEARKKEALIESLNKEKREVLLYGIDTEVQDVISTIRSEKDENFNDELLLLLENNENPEINRAILDFFSEMKEDAGRDKASELLLNHIDDYEYSTNLLLSAISYLGEIEAEGASDIFYDLLEDNNKSLASAALRGIGKLKDSARAEEIHFLLEEYSGDEEYQDFSATAILVLGELGYEEAQIYFEDILQDEDAPASHRQYAALSIGEFGKAEGLELLQSMYTLSEDSQLRSYILKGITKYDDDGVETLLISALRDSFWRIRVAAAEGLGERKTSDAVDILQYKVRKDPVRHVRYASMDALAEIGGNEAEDFLKGQFEEERTAFDIRQRALNLMIEHKISGSVESLKTVLGPKWDKDKDNELGPICKILSTSEWSDLKPFYAMMLGHKDFIIRIYGIRGVKINGLTGLKDAVAALDAEEQPVNVRREAKAALESF